MKAAFEKLLKPDGRSAVAVHVASRLWLSFLRLGGKRMTKRFRDFVSFAVMATLIFVVISLRIRLIAGSSGTGIRYYHFPWIVMRQDIWTTSVSHIYTGKLVAMIALSPCLTWVLSKLLKVLHAKKMSGIAWLLFIVIIVFFLIAYSVPNIALT